MNNQQNNFSELLNSLKSGNPSQQKSTAQNLAKKLNKSDSEELNSIISDPSRISAILNSPAAKLIKDKLNGNG